MLEVEKKAARMEVDRLSELPYVLQLHILSCLDTKQAVQTSVLSKTWVPLWTSIPVLELNYLHFSRFDMFDTFVKNVLSRRDDSATLDRLKFNCHKSCSSDTLKNVYDYAISHDVKQLEASIVTGDYSWQPFSVCDSLTSLKLQNMGGGVMRCLFLGPGSKSFKNLAVLYLKRALITDVDPFSGFPLLESLTLLNCEFRNESKTIRIHGVRLSDLTVLPCSKDIDYELRTPRLRFLKYYGPFFSTDYDHGLSVLETVEIESADFMLSGQELEQEQEGKRLINDMLSMFTTLDSVKSLKLSPAILHVLFLFPDELARRGGSPFRELKDLKLDLSEHYCDFPSGIFQSPNRESFEAVKAYFLHNSPDAKFTVTKPESLKCMLSLCYEYRNL